MAATATGSQERAAAVPGQQGLPDAAAKLNLEVWGPLTLKLRIWYVGVQQGLASDINE